MYEVYRVLRTFQWRGKMYSPPGPCGCECNQAGDRRELNQCSGQVATACTCPDAGYCGCRIKPQDYGGDIWLVEAGNPRKQYILNNRFAIYDASLPSGDELIKSPVFAALVQDPRLRREGSAGIDYPQYVDQRGYVASR